MDTSSVRFLRKSAERSFATDRSPLPGRHNTHSCLTGSGRWFSRAYDAAGNVTAIGGSAAEVVYYTYDERDNVSVAAPEHGPAARTNTAAARAARIDRPAAAHAQATKKNRKNWSAKSSFVDT